MSGDGEDALVSIEARRGPLGGSGGGMYPVLLLFDAELPGSLGAGAYGGRAAGTAPRSDTTTTPLLNAEVDGPPNGGI